MLWNQVRPLGSLTAWPFLTAWRTFHFNKKYIGEATIGKTMQKTPKAQGMPIPPSTSSATLDPAKAVMM